jgi:hypothetical protein
MMERVKLVVVIPVGPTCIVDFVRDTIDSVLYYTNSSRKIIILDDSQKKSGQALLQIFHDLIVLETPKNYGKNSGLYLNLSAGLKFAYENFSFDVLLRIDTDALITGYYPEEDAARYFIKHPDCGIIGSYKKDCNGYVRDFTWPREQLLSEIGATNLFRHPNRFSGIFFLRKILSKSRRNGYELGEHCLGGAYFINYKCVEGLFNSNLLSRDQIKWSLLQEDHIFGLMIYSIGYKHGDFVSDPFPMGLAWRGLPCSPAELLERRKKVIHSTHFFEEQPENEIRDYFKKIREA